MKVLAIQGSPRKKGNTDLVLDRVMAAVRQKGHRSLGKVYAAKLNVSGCIECMACQGVAQEPGCAIKDDMQAVYKKIMQADLIIFASPVFCWGLSAQLKAVVDRLFATFKFDDEGEYVALLGGKRAALVVTAGGTKDEGADLCKAAFDRLVRFGRMKSSGALIAPLLREPADTKRDAKLMKKAEAFGERIARSLEPPRRK